MKFDKGMEYNSARSPDAEIAVEQGAASQELARRVLRRTGMHMLRLVIYRSRNQGANYKECVIFRALGENSMRKILPARQGAHSRRPCLDYSANVFSEQDEVCTGDLACAGWGAQLSSNYFPMALPGL